VLFHITISEFFQFISFSRICKNGGINKWYGNKVTMWDFTLVSQDSVEEQLKLNYITQCQSLKFDNIDNQSSFLSSYIYAVKCVILRLKILSKISDEQS